MNILIVEDNDESRYMLESLLKGRGYDVIPATNGVEAIERLKKERFDMIISDILMPKMDGFSLCRKCKSDDTLRKIPFVFYTATYTDKKDEEFALSLGAEKFIVKPVEPDKFLEILEAVIEEHEAGTLTAPKRPVEDETVYLAEYNKRLIEKLEHKALNLEKELAERKRAEEALRRERDKAQRYFDVAGVMLVAIDTEQRVGRINKKGCDILGYKEEEILGKNWFDNFLPSRIKDETKAVFEKLIRAEVDAPEYRENPILTKSGDERLMAWHNTVLRGEKGRIIATLSSGEDITERKRAEEALRESEAELFAVLENVPSILIVVDEDRRVHRLNKSAAEFGRRTTEEMIGLRGGEALRCLHSLDDPKGCGYGPFCEICVVRNTVLETFKTGKSFYQREAQLPFDIDGKAEELSLFVSTTTVEIGGTPMVLVCLENITKRKQAEEALRVHGEIMANMSEGVYLIRASDGVIVYTNPKFDQMFGYSPGQLIGKHVPIVNAPTEKTPEETAEKITKVLNEKGSWRGEICNIKKDGTLFWCYASVSVFEHPEHGNVWVSMHTDITERKQAEEEIGNLAKFPSENPYPVVRIAADGTILYANPASNTLLAERKSGAGQLCPSDWRGMVSDVLKSGSVKRIEVRHKERTFAFRIVPVQDANYVNFYGTDITERKEAKKRLLNYQGQLKSLASQLSLAEEREKRRIATELHDQVGQSLVISKLKLETLRESASSAELGEALEEVCNSLGQTIADTRSLMFEVHSPLLDLLGFEAAVATWLADRVEGKYGIKTEFEDDGQPKPLDEDVRIFLFRDVRELLMNVVKHAQARKVKVSIRKVGRQIQVGVEDDGVGFDPEKVAATAVRKGGFGLFSIRERLEQFGGQLEIASVPGQGTKVTVMAPLKEEKINRGQ